MQRPAITEHKPYAKTYIDLVPEGQYIASLQNNTAEVLSFYNAIPEEKHNHAYADGKWTIKEVLMHIIDTERVMTYRALTGIRGDNKAQLSDMDQNIYAADLNLSNRTMQDILEEFSAVRMASLKLFQNTTEEQSKREVRLVDGGMFTVRAFGYLIIGHAIHHNNIIMERYLHN